MRLFIDEGASAKVITVECGLSDKVKDIKLQVHKKKGHPVARQILYKGSTKLLDGKTVNDYKLGKDARLTLKLTQKDTKACTKSSTPIYLVASKSTSCSINVTFQSEKPVKHAVVLSHDEVTVKTSGSKPLEGMMTSQVHGHVFPNLHSATEYNVQVFVFKSTSGEKECVHSETVSTGPSIPEMVVSISEINNILVSWNPPKLGDVSYYEISLYNTKNTSSEIVSFVKSHDEVRRLLFRDLEPQTYTVRLCAILNDDVRSDTVDEQIDTEYYIEVDKIDSRKNAATVSWKSPKHEDFTQFELSLWDASHTEGVAEPCFIDSEERSYTWKDLDPGTIYTCELVGVLDDGIKRGKVLVHVKTECEIVICNCQTSSSTIELSWTSPNNQEFTSYVVTLETADSDKIVQEYKLLSREENQYSHTFDDVTPDTVYMLSICGVFADGSKTNKVSQKATTETEIFHLYNVRKYKDLNLLETSSYHWSLSIVQEVEKAKEHIVTLLSNTRMEEDSKDLSAMLESSKSGDFEQAIAVIDKKPYLLNVISEDRAWSVLHWAVHHNNGQVVKRLLSYPSCNVHVKATGDQGGKGRAGCTPLDLATLHEECEELRNILEDCKAKEIEPAQKEGGTFSAEGMGEKSVHNFVKEGIPFFLLGLTFLEDDMWNRLGLWQVHSYLQLTERLFDLVTEEWSYFLNVISKTIKTFDKAIADRLKGQPDSNNFLRAMLKDYFEGGLYRQVNKVLQKPLTTKSSTYTIEDICLSLYSLVVHSTLLHWQQLSRSSSTTYCGVILKMDQVKNYEKGTSFVWLPFTYCSTDLESSMKLATQAVKTGDVGVLFIHNNDGQSNWKPCDVTEFFSQKKTETLLYPAGVEFRVNNVVPVYSNKAATEIYIGLGNAL